uniref:Uncharacterized protein n=1 Tax=Paramoeba aestuarina TaxID=180227 RepID=A0A7S4NZF0_9EUKA
MAPGRYIIPLKMCPHLAMRNIFVKQAVTKPLTLLITMKHTINNDKNAPRFEGERYPSSANTVEATDTARTWDPDPMKIAKRAAYGGFRKTSPLISFHPVSSLKLYAKASPMD